MLPLPSFAPQDPTEERLRHLIVPIVEFQSEDVREALRRLFREHLIGGSIAPDVQGTVTMSLRNVPFETALQNVTRQVDATYRIDHGFFQVVRRSEEGMDSPRMTKPRNEVVEAYATISDAIARGDGASLRRRLVPKFEFRNATATLTGEPAVRLLIDENRRSGAPVTRGVDYRPGKGIDWAESVVAYRRGESPARFFRDFWRRASGVGWILERREETAGTVRRRFVNQRLSEIAHALGEDVGVSFEVDPRVDRQVTVDLGYAPFETFLQEVVRSAGATYRLEGGVYRVVPGSGAPEDPGERRIPFIEFEKSDVRMVLSWLCRQAGVPYRIDLKAKGPVTVSLRNASFETALQNVCRQVGLTYRVEDGVWQIIPRVDLEDRRPLLRRTASLERAYREIEDWRKLATRISPDFSFSDERNKISKGSEAFRASLEMVVGKERRDVRTAIVLEAANDGPRRVGVIVEYGATKDGPVDLFWDEWTREPNSSWRLQSRSVTNAPI